MMEKYEGKIHSKSDFKTKQEFIIQKWEQRTFQTKKD